jgi:hypothetical protein
MKFVLFLVAFVLPAMAQLPNLDSLIARNKIEERRASTINGFVIHRKYMPEITLESPETLFRNRDSEPADRLIPRSDRLLYDRIYQLEMENKKIAFLIQSLQTQSNSHSSNAGFMMKLIEILATSFTAMLVAYIGGHVKRKLSE